jgi:DNA-binding NtrC family response regulator
MSKKILICEDEKGLQDLFKNMLTSKSYEVIVAGDGKVALEKAKETKPDLIMLDIRMPKINGLEVAKGVRKFNKKARIIFLTGFQSPELTKEAAKYDIFDFLTKNSSTQDILKSIQNALK